ncbi:hypothetical protein QUF99_15020 [Bacillus sp. DX4.1]|uniref:hypothetical protein n=1 Tax=Bacillus sp. DX4.1 TaxID=3055867 RepID=UPI0025A05E63|nr:hypothetical protein [Bacillus sp. DX4.1]MDM5188580.1 hypothetical protein [Bacillus sp. DX4.1]
MKNLVCWSIYYSPRMFIYRLTTHFYTFCILLNDVHQGRLFTYYNRREDDNMVCNYAIEIKDNLEDKTYLLCEEGKYEVLTFATYEEAGDYNYEFEDALSDAPNIEAFYFA